MRDKYIWIRLCRYALQALGFFGLMASIALFSTLAPQMGIVGMLTGLFFGLIVLALCFGIAELLVLLTDVERALQGLRDDLHDRFPLPEERIRELAQRNQTR